jgi:hypothetical protein
VQTGNARFHQFTGRVDPYVVPGDAASGLLPGIDANGPGPEGQADARVQAYCYRLCATDDPGNRVPWPRPDGYDPRDYELLLRHFEAGSTLAPWHPVGMPNRKTDSNNNGAVSTDWIGQNYDYPTADYATRERIAAAHKRYQQGLLWTLANDPRVPAEGAAEFQRYGLARTSSWPPGTGRRCSTCAKGAACVGEGVVTEASAWGALVDPDPVGMGAYAMDSHNVQRYVAADGSVRNEGDVQVKVPQPYGISFRAWCRSAGRSTTCWCRSACSSSHIAYGSIRMEPVFMVLAESAAIAADLVLRSGSAVQDLAVRGTARTRLLAAGQVLSWPVVAPR